MNKINEFVMTFQTKNTQKAYRLHLQDYFRTLNLNPDEYFDKKRDYERDIMDYSQKITHLAPLTRHGRLSCVKTFLDENDVTINAKVWRNIKKRSKGKRALTIDAIPTNEQLRQILSHGDIMIKTIALISSSSGMRINEILGLIPQDVYMNENPLRIYIRPEISKNGIPRICFASSEARESLQQWFNVRDEWLNLANKRNFKKKDSNAKEIFPLEYSNFDKKWNRLLKKSGNNERDPTTKIRKYHFHTLRKFFETRMSIAGVPEAIYQQLEGHTGYLNGSYKRYTEEDLKKEYMKGVQSLLVYETQPDISKIHEEMQLKDEQIKSMERRIDELNQTMILLLAKNSK